MFKFKSIYSKFAFIFLLIWWFSNGATFGVLIRIVSNPEIRKSIVLAFISHTIMGTIIILIALRNVVKPIKKLSLASQKVAKGNFDVSVDIKNKDEIGRLAVDFNIMVKELGSIDKMRREFVSDVSHEYRTPITSIMGYAKLIKDENGYSDIIIKESERLIDLSSNLLRLSEIDNKIIHSNTTFSLDEQIRQVILVLEPLWSAKNIEFDIDFPELNYNGDEELIRQIWLNLISNAIKFSHDNGIIKIEISESYEVKIIDNGIGIEKDKLNYIFDRFYKNKTSKGSGLGLAIVSKIVEFIGGSVSVKSEIGKGAEFAVVLP